LIGYPGVLRNFVNILAGAIFILGLPALLFLDSALRYARDGEALVDSARAARLREALVDATAALVVGEVARDPTLAAADRIFIRGGVDHVLSAEWFDGSIRSAHAAMVAGARGASRTAVLELEAFKQALQVRLGLLEDRADQTCRALFGAEPCLDRGRAQELIDAYRRRGQRAIARIPHRILLWPDAGGAENLDLLATARRAGLGLLLASVIALAAASWRRPGVLGAILTAGAGLFLVLALALRLGASGPVARLLVARARVLEAADEPARIAAEGLRRLASEVVADATRTGMLAAGGLAAAGVVLVAAARRRSRSVSG
jgi:hypothetical protein